MLACFGGTIPTHSLPTTTLSTPMAFLHLDQSIPTNQPRFLVSWISICFTVVLILLFLFLLSPVCCDSYTYMQLWGYSNTKYSRTRKCPSRLPCTHTNEMNQQLQFDANAQAVACVAAAATLKALEYQVAFALATLDKDLTKEYYNALEIVPEIVTEETKFVDFLRTEDYVPLLATQRIARFWKVRKKLFGERWLLKLSQTGTGCLSMEDVQVLRTGYFSVCKSEQLGMVWLMDYSRLPPGARYFQPNVIYYMGTVTSCQAAQRTTA